MAGLYLEEFVVGHVFQHTLRKTVTESDNMLFSVMTLNPQPLHIDFDFCRQERMGQAAGQLAVHARPDDRHFGQRHHRRHDGRQSRHEGNVSFPHPVFHGDTIRVETTVISARESRSRPDRGIVEFEHRAYNQHGDLVAKCTRQAMMMKKAGLMRSLLFVPGDFEQKLEKGLSAAPTW